MPSTRLRGVLAVLPVLLAFVLVPSASATCGAIDAFVPSGKLWYSAADAPPTVLFDMVDDEASPKDFMNVTTQAWLSAAPLGAFGFVTTPGWSSYTPGANAMEARLHCASGLVTWQTRVYWDPIAPVVSWSQPAAGSWLRGTVTLGLAGADTLSGVTSFATSWPGGSSSSAGGSTAFDSTAVADGTTVLSGVSVDYVGNRSAPVTRVVRIDNSAPVVSVDPPASAFVSSNTVAVVASASDAGSGVAQVRFEGRADGAGAWQPLGSDGDAPFRIVMPTPAVEGDYELRAVATDAIGNEAVSAGRTLAIDRVAPTVTLNALPALVSGTIGLAAAASDAGSGVAHAEFQAAPAGSGDWQTVGTDDVAPWAARLATPALGDGAYDLRVSARDLAGNETFSALRSTVIRNGAASIVAPLATPATAVTPAGSAAPGAGKRRVALAARALPHRVEGGHPIVVRGTAKGLAHGVVIVTLQNARRPSLVQRIRTTTASNGSFRSSFVPHFSGRIRVRFAGDAGHRSAGADAGVVRVHPRLVVDITATRSADGALENPHVRGRLLPAGGPVRVVWQARPAHGGAWLLFCRTADQLAVGRNGVIDGTCHVGGLNPGNRYRLVVLGDAGASYLPAATKAMVARPTS